MNLGCEVLLCGSVEIYIAVFVVCLAPVLYFVLKKWLLWLRWLWMAGELFTDINVAVSQSTAAPLSTLTQSVKAQRNYARPISLCL